MHKPRRESKISVSLLLFPYQLYEKRISSKPCQAIPICILGVIERSEKILAMNECKFALVGCDEFIPHLCERCEFGIKSHTRKSIPHSN